MPPVSLVRCAYENETADMKSDYMKETGLVPMPKSVTPGKGRLTLGTRIVAASPELLPLAEVVAQECLLLTGKKMSILDAARYGRIPRDAQCS